MGKTLWQMCLTVTAKPSQTILQLVAAKHDADADDDADADADADDIADADVADDDDIADDNDDDKERRAGWSNIS